jgi:hypothetical protein
MALGYELIERFGDHWSMLAPDSDDLDLTASNPMIAPALALPLVLG